MFYDVVSVWRKFTYTSAIRTPTAVYSENVQICKPHSNIAVGSGVIIRHHQMPNTPGGMSQSAQGNAQS